MKKVDGKKTTCGNGDCSCESKEKKESTCTCHKEECTCGCQEGKKCTCQTEATGKEAEYLDALQRLMAEFDNYRKRNNFATLEAREAGRLDAAEKLLPCMDALDKAEETVKDEASKKGITLVKTEMINALKSMGIEAIDALGKPFDPMLHNAVIAEEVKGKEPNIVLEQYQKGYKTINKVLRYAMVKVSK